MTAEDKVSSHQRGRCSKPVIKTVQCKKGRFGSGLKHERSTIEMIIAGTNEAITMVEGGAAEATEAEMLDVLDLAHDAIRKIIGAIDEVINTWLHSGGSYDLVSMADPLVDLFIRGVGNPEVVNR